MRLLKNHLGFILPLIALLFALQFSVLANAVLKEYENLMSKDYNIIIVSQKELSKEQISSQISDFASIEMLPPDKIISRLEGEISAKNIALLKNALPKFYSLKLASFVNSQKLSSIKKSLLNIQGITQVEIFLKTHDKIYKALKLSQYLSLTFVSIIAAIGLMLMLKQIRIWLLEHRERIEIMTLFGAGFWLKSGILYRTAIIDSVIATAIVVACFMFAPDLDFIVQLLSQIDLSMPKINLIHDVPILLGAALGFSIIAVSVVMKSHKKLSDEA